MQSSKSISRTIITIIIVLCCIPGIARTDAITNVSRWKLGFIQAWNENMQDGISRLNMEPQQGGVTPIVLCFCIKRTFRPILVGDISILPAMFSFSQRLII
jgi:hypothetical protein